MASAPKQAKHLLFVLGDSISNGYGPFLKAAINGSSTTTADKSPAAAWRYGRKNENVRVLYAAVLTVLLCTPCSPYTMQNGLDQDHQDCTGTAL